MSEQPDIKFEEDFINMRNKIELEEWRIENNIPCSSCGKVIHVSACPENTNM